MSRIIMMIVRNLFFFPISWIRLHYYKRHPEKYSDADMYAYIQYMDTHANKGGNVTIDAHGVENIPKENGFIFFPNHQGLYDVLPVIQASPVPFSIVAKKELAHIPFLGQIFACMGVYLMDREDLRQSMRVIQQVAKDVSGGKNVLIFPEGTRSKNGNTLGEFKGGSFKAATKAKCPIVPVALIDSFKPFDSHSTKPVTVQVYFLKPLLYEDYQSMKTSEIATLVHDQIQATVNAHLVAEA